MQPKAREVAQGRWRGILASFGLSDRQLSGRHGPCPVCGGKDRFRFDDKGGRGTYYCSHCGAGDGIALVMAWKGIDFREAAQEIERAAGVVLPAQARPTEDEAQKMARLKRTWAEASPLLPGDEAMAYLAGRGLRLDTPPKSLRLHPGLAYYDGAQIIGKFPAMLALVAGQDGKAVTIHRTFLKGGYKAPVLSPKKLMPGKAISGAAIRLLEAGIGLGIAEGIETALAASTLFSLPVWSCISAHGIETFEPPDGIRHVTIFADNDENFVGQKAAYAAASRLQQRGFQVEVKIPPIVGDWLDVINGR